MQQNSGYLDPFVWQKESRMSDDSNEPITFKRVQRRLTMLLEVMPKSIKDIHTDQLLPNIIADLREIRAAVAYLATQPTEREKK